MVNEFFYVLAERGGRAFPQFVASVYDNLGERICECYTIEAARRIVNALNAPDDTMASLA